MSNEKRTIDVLERNDLIKIAKKLNIYGSSNNFTKPYKNKEYIKHEILAALNQKNVSNLCKMDPLNSLHCKVKKLVAIGDIHGDLVAAIKSLKLAGVISLSVPNDTMDVNNIQWTGGETFVVQLGDQIDRCRPSNWINDICSEDDEELYQDEGSDLKIICLFDNLHKQALKQGGALFSILGNHELMNVDGDFRYVSPREFREFGNFFKAKKSSKRTKYPYGYAERKKAFEPGGVIAKKLAANRFSLLQIGSWLFVHGGISPEMAKKYSINDVNKCIRDWMVGSKDKQTKTGVQELYHNDDESFSPFWSRLFTDLEEWDCNTSSKMFYQTLDILNKRNGRNETNKIKGMIMGHSPQFMYDKCLNSACNNKLWRVDVGMSRAFGSLQEPDICNKNRKVQILVIINDEKCQIVREK
jgi:hypothetical protein